MNYTSKHRVAVALEKIDAKRGGRITPEEVIKAARPKNSPLYDQFEWNDKKAGHQHRLNQARKLINTVLYDRRVEYKDVPAPVYARDPTVGNEQGYIRTAVLRSDEEASIETLKRNVKRIVSSIERSQSLAEELDLVAELDKMLRDADILIGKLDQLAVAA